MLAIKQDTELIGQKVPGASGEEHEIFGFCRRFDRVSASAIPTSSDHHKLTVSRDFDVTT